MTENNSLLRNFFKILKIANFSTFQMAIPLLLSLFASVFDGFSAGLFIPVLKGLIDRDFKQLLSLPGIKQVSIFIPESISTQNFSLFLLIIFFIALCSILRITLETLSSFHTTKNGIDLAHNLRIEIFKRYLSFGKEFFDNNSSGNLLSICKHYTSSVAQRLSDVKRSFGWLILLAVYLCLMFYISWKLTLFALILFPIHHLSTQWLIKKIKLSAHYLTELDKANQVYLSNMLSSIALIKISNNESHEIQKYDLLSRALKNASFSREKKNVLLLPVQQIILMVTLFLFIVAIGHMASRTASIEISSVLVFLYLLRRGASGFTAIASMQSTLALLSGETNEILKVFDENNKFFIPSGTRKFSALKKEIRLNQLSFSYSSGGQALRDISLAIPSKKTTALVGKTGSGKTTIANLILRLYDCPTNSILIDGVDIREYEIASIREKIAYISQDQYLFNDTILNNLTYGIKRIVESDEIFDALEKAQLKDLVNSLPNGINSLVGDKGVQLSGGERQRLTIARTFLQHPEIIIMDEATSALDSKTEQVVTDAVNKLKVDRTTIVIAHRLSTIKNADYIAVIENGQIKEEGTLEFLINKGADFYQLWASQYFVEEK